MSRKADTSLPHSWSIEHWPQDVWPGSTSKARYLVRANRDSLIAAGVLSRVGRELIFVGARYARWIEKQAVNVPDYMIAPNAKTSSVEA
jgi:hypothetical protein